MTFTESEILSSEEQPVAAFSSTPIKESSTPIKEGLQDSGSERNASSKALFAEHLFKPDTNKT